MLKKRVWSQSVDLFCCHFPLVFWLEIRLIPGPRDTYFEWILKRFHTKITHAKEKQDARTTHGLMYNTHVHFWAWIVSTASCRYTFTATLHKIHITENVTILLYAANSPSYFSKWDNMHMSISNESRLPGETLKPTFFSYMQNYWETSRHTNSNASTQTYT